MTPAEEPISIATGTLVEVQMWSTALADAGIDHKVVGDELATSFGTALQGSVELWVHAKDVKAAEEVLQKHEAEHQPSSSEE